MVGKGGLGIMLGIAYLFRFGMEYGVPRFGELTFDLPTYGYTRS